MKFAIPAVFTSFLLCRTLGFPTLGNFTPSVNYSDPSHLIEGFTKTLKDYSQYAHKSFEIFNNSQITSDFFNFLEEIQRTGNFSESVDESHIINDLYKYINVLKRTGKFRQSANATQILEAILDSLEIFAKSCTVDSSFPYIIPLDQSQSCDVFGPVCQTGSITVEVSRCDIEISSTVLPCSSYLMEQSTFLFNGASNANAFSWSSAFGLSPQCRSYASAYQSSGLYTLSNCGMQVITQPSRTNSEMCPLPSQIPPAVLQSTKIETGFAMGKEVSWFCCGGCQVFYEGVNLFYFPDDNASSYCHSKSLSITADPFSTYITNSRPELQAETDTEIIAVLSGHTFTSPSVYLRLEGPPSISNLCLDLVTTLTDSWIAFAPGQLSTYSDAAPQQEDCVTFVTESFGNALLLGGKDPVYKSLNVADLACPTWGVGDQPPRSNVFDEPECLSIGPPYRPIIVPPASQIYPLAPKHVEECPNGISLFTDGQPLLLIDPATVLSPQKRLTPPGNRFRKREILTTESSPTTTTKISTLLPVERRSVNTPQPTASSIRS